MLGLSQTAGNVSEVKNLYVKVELTKGPGSTEAFCTYLCAVPFGIQGDIIENLSKL